MADYYTTISATESKIMQHVAEHQPVCGVQIIEGTGMPKGSVYALLRKLVAKGLVIPTEETSEHRETRGGRGPARVLYTTPPDMLDHFPFIRILVARKFKELLAAQAAK